MHRALARCRVARRGSITGTQNCYLILTPRHTVVLVTREGVDGGSEPSRCLARAAELGQGLRWSPPARRAEYLLGSPKLTFLTLGPRVGAIAPLRRSAGKRERAQPGARPSPGGGSRPPAGPSVRWLGSRCLRPRPQPRHAPPGHTAAAGPRAAGLPAEGLPRPPALSLQPPRVSGAGLRGGPRLDSCGVASEGLRRLRLWELGHF